MVLLAVGSLLIACSGGAGEELADQAQSGQASADPQPAAIAAPPTVALNGVVVKDTLVFAGQPTQAEFEEFADAGYRILDLRRASEKRGFDQGAAAAELEADYQNVPVDRAALTDPSTHAAFAAALNKSEAENRPLLVHCASGNRVAGLYYAHLVEHGELDRALALERAKELGLSSPGVEEAVETYLDTQSATAEE